MVREVSPFSLSRAKILALLKKEPMNISELIRRSKMSRPTIYHHLTELKKRKLVSEKKFPHKKGTPVLLYYPTDKADPVPLKILETFELLYPKVFKKVPKSSKSKHK